MSNTIPYALPHLLHIVLSSFILSAGSVIHAVSDEQDTREMGSFVRFLPLTYSLISA